MTIIKFRRRNRFSPTQLYRRKLDFAGHRSIKYLVVLAALAVLVVAVFLQTEIDTRAPESSRAAPISVIDGDTVRANGRVYRLVGFDTPESGSLARCERERKLADAATSRLRELSATGQPALERISCSCPRGTEGTRECNYGRFCATLRADGRDVGDI